MDRCNPRRVTLSGQAVLWRQLPTAAAPAAPRAGSWLRVEGRESPCAPAGQRPAAGLPHSHALGRLRHLPSVDFPVMPISAPFFPCLELGRHRLDQAQVAKRHSVVAA